MRPSLSSLATALLGALLVAAAVSVACVSHQAPTTSPSPPGDEAVAADNTNHNCPLTAQADVVLDEREACWLEVLGGRCNPMDRCIAACISKGEGRRNAGGCFHNCGSGGEWSEPLGWDRCAGLPHKPWPFDEEPNTR